MPLDSTPSLKNSSAAGTPASRPPNIVSEPVSLAPPAALSAPPSMETLWQVMRQKWLLMLALGLLGGFLGGVGAWFLTPGKYMTTAVLQFPKMRGYSEGDENLVYFQRTQTALIKGPSLIQKVLASQDIQELPEVRAQSDPSSPTWVIKDLVTDTLTVGPDILRVSFGGDRPDDVAAILGKLVQVYQEEYRAREEAKMHDRKELLKKKYETISRDLRDRRLTLRKREKEYGIEDPQELNVKIQTELSLIGSLENQKLQYQLRRKEYESELASKKQKLDNPKDIVVPKYVIDRELRADPIVGRQMDRIAALQSLIIEQQRLAVDSRKARELQAEQDGIRRNIQQFSAVIEDGQREKAVEEIRETIGRLESQIGQTKPQEKELDGQIIVKRAQLEQLRASGRSPAAIASGIDELRDHVNQTELVLQRIGQDLGTIEADAAAAAQIIVIDAPQAPTERRIDRKLKMAGVAGLGMFGLVFCGVAMLEFGKRRVYTSDDVSRGLGLNLLGSLPLVHGNGAGHPAVAVSADATHPEQLAVLEAVDAVRTVLLHAARAEKFHTLMVTSPGMGEGKTSLACQLAASLARSGRKTLLMDCDLRNPVAHLPFRVPLAPGVCEVLRGEALLEAVVHPTDQENLALLPAGQLDRVALQALNQDELQTVFTLLKDSFEFVVIDSSPVLPVADALLIGQHADAVLLSVLRNVSRLPAIYAAQQKLASLGVRILGAVLAGDTANSYGMVPYRQKLTK